MRKVYAKNGLEVWASYNRAAKVWEMFASETLEGYVGWADSIKECKTFAKDWAAKRNAV